jgi:hypothetical protein
MSCRRPSRTEQAKMDRLFRPPQPQPRPSLWQRMAHRQATCDGPGKCPLCPPPAKGPMEGSAA